MSAVSVVTSTITLIGTIEACSKNLRKIWALRDAPANLESLMNELQDFGALLDVVKDGVKALQCVDTDASIAHVETIIQRGVGLVEELNSLIGNRLCRREVVDDEPHIRLRGWLKQKRLERIRFSLAETRQRLVAALTAMNTLQLRNLPRLLLSVQSISLVTNADLDKDNMSETADTSTPLEQSMHELVTTSQTAVSKTNSRSSFLLVQTRAIRCSISCSCQCHIKTTGQSPRWLSSVFGSLFYQFTGFPILNQRPCNLASCRHEGRGSARFEYRFPTWFLPLVILVSADWNDIHGIGGSWSLRVPHYIPPGGVCLMIQSGEAPTKIMQFVTTHKISPRAVHSHWGDSLLDYAVRAMNPELCQLLLLEGADWSFQRPDGLSTAQYAWWRVLSLISTTDASLHLKDLLERSNPLEDPKFNAIHKIVLGSSNSNLQDLVTLYPDLINGADVYGRTPLMWACRRDNLEAVTILLSHGADITIKDRRKETALHIATSARCAQAVMAFGTTCLDALDIDGYSPLCYSCEEVDLDRVLLFLENGADPNVECPYPPIFAAAEWGELDILQALVKYGANIDKPSYWNRTALMAVIKVNRADCVEFLLGKGARLDVVDDHGDDVLSLVAKCASPCIMRMLMDAPVRYLDTSSASFEKYWELFIEERDSRYVGLRAPVEEERAAFAGLLTSVIDRGKPQQTPALGLMMESREDPEDDNDLEGEYVDAKENVVIDE